MNDIVNPLTNEVGILIQASLDKARINKKKRTQPLEFYAVVGYPPTSFNAIAALLAQVAPGGSLQGLSISIKQNRELKRPHPGIGDDWLIVRAYTQYAPQLYALDGHEINLANPNDAQTVRTDLFSGQKVRLAATPFLWTNPDDSREHGISLQLDGVLAVGGGEKRAGSGGRAENAFAAFRPQGADQPQQHQNAFGGSQQTSGNAFGQQANQQPVQQEQPAQTGGQSFGGAGGATQGNPFAQGSGGSQQGGNPFAPR